MSDKTNSKNGKAGVGKVSVGRVVIRSKKATAAEIRSTLMIKPTNEAAGRRANRAAEAALEHRY